MADKQRLQFLIKRESTQQGVTDFALRAQSQYRRANLSAKRKYGKRHTYRKAYITSYLFHKLFLHKCKESLVLGSSNLKVNDTGTHNAR